MSCKILDESIAQSAEPMPWARAPLPAPQSRPTALYLADAEPASDSPDERSAWEQRIRELEASAEARIREAHARGRKEGEAQALQQYQARVEQMASIVQATASLRARLRRESEVDLVQLSIAIARRILRRELSVDPDALGGIVKACLGKLESRQIQRVRLHPTFAEALRTRLDSSVALAADPHLAPGDIRIETDQGEIDAGMETQLAEIERGFADLLPQRSHA